jgi:hypothetical protein
VENTRSTSACWLSKAAHFSAISAIF